ncbi:MAG TPA: ABC transporter permease [Solirubrobacterales bacterium]|nr:ABC transporter permease [Solirubrobacterales bacterium]
MSIATPIFASFGGAIEFILSPQASNVTGGKTVGGIDQVIELAFAQLEVTVLALLLSLLIALPAGLYFGHRGKGELVAIGLGNTGRAIPELGLIALMAAVVGVGLGNLTVALAVLGIPPILVNTFVGVREVDRSTVEAARGMGMTQFEVIRKVEAPMAVTSIFTGIRTAAIGIVATATIAPLAGVATLGEFILGENVYGSNGVLAGAIVVALLALAIEFSLAGLQRLLTSKGLKLRTT